MRSFLQVVELKRIISPSKYTFCFLMFCHFFQFIRHCFVKGVANAYKHRGNHIVTTTIEHPSVSEVCKFLESKSFRVTYVPVDNDGIIDLKALEKSITKDTILVSVMHVHYIRRSLSFSLSLSCLTDLLFSSLPRFFCSGQ